MLNTAAIVITMLKMTIMITIIITITIIEYNVIMIIMIDNNRYNLHNTAYKCYRLMNCL